MKYWEHNGTAADCCNSLSLDSFLLCGRHTVSLVIKDTLIRDLFSLKLFYKQTKLTCGLSGSGWKSTASKKIENKKAFTIRAELFYCDAESCTKLAASWLGFMTAVIVHVYLHGRKALY